MKREVITDIIIPLKGLAPGVHSFGFSIEQSLFDRFENQEIKNALLEAHVELNKIGSRIDLIISIDGTVVRSCDRCLGDIVVPIDYRAPLIVTFSSSGEVEESEDMMVLKDNDTEIDLTQYLYDSVCVSLPLQSIHIQGACDPDMEKRIAELSVN
ncbi:MAG: DUF177 domain-containing protein [Prevotellaceae bacterium]|nr:DUF177 domain-containing protein [Prevotellaceae bacterium]